MKRAVHMNSVDAHAAGRKGAFSRRRAEILATVEDMGEATDRAIARRLGFEDMNCVRPRITEMIHDGVLQECGETEDPITHRTVRVVRQPVLPGLELQAS